MLDTTREYGAAIALVSGLYSVVSSTGGMGWTVAGLLMAVLGVVVVVHGVLLLTAAADRIRTVSGPLMVAYSLAMLLNQAIVGLTGSANWGMGAGTNGGMGTGMGSGVTAGMGWDLGMVALAVLMLVSGVIMAARRDADAGM